MERPRILYVHGAGPQPAPDDLRREIDEILFPDRPDVSTDVAWYADVTDTLDGPEGREQERLAPGDAAVLSVPATQPVAGGAPDGGGDRDPRDDPDDDNGLMDRARDLLSDASDLTSRFVGARGHALLRLAAAMGALEDRAVDRLEGERGLLPPHLWHFYRDCSGYFHGDPEQVDLMRRRVREAIERNPDPLLVVAHSLGTLITFDVLSEEALAGRRVALVTVGSPLGLSPVQDRLAAWSGARPIGIPASVVSWRNFHAAGDPVATGSDLDGLRGDYHPNARVHSTLVRNEAEWHHAFSGYLRTPEVQDAIRALLGLGRRDWQPSTAE